MMIKLRYYFRTCLFTLFYAITLGYSTVTMAEEPVTNTKTPQQAEFKVLAKQVLVIMDQWARSWAQLEPRGYISSYSSDYIGKGFPSHFTWAANRQQRLQKQKFIKLSLTDVSLQSTKQDFFTVTFTQNYESDTYKDVTKKQLRFKRINGQWYIIAEKTLAKK